LSLFKCKMCGGDLELTGKESVAVCQYCGTQQTLPRLDSDRKANLYDRANHFRRNNEFDKAMAIYEQILNEDAQDAEAYWSLVLCRYGIEYVEDPASHKRIPTVNRAQFTAVFDDDNYKSALKYADSLQRSVYEEEAAEFNRIQKGILAISQKEEPFDIFICYKETDQGGRRTLDSVLAQDLYYQLVQEGFKVFFSRITLEDKLGSAYEPYIFAALNSAKVMVVLGTRPEHFKAVWVRNEWSRYLSLIKQGQKKTLIPAYRDMDPYDLPEEFSHLQALDMSKLGFMQDLIRGIKKIAQTEKPAAETKANAAQNSAVLFVKRAAIFLEDGNLKSADEYCEKALDMDPEYAQAYVVKLLMDLKLKSRKELSACPEPFDNNPNYLRAIRFGDEALRTELTGYVEGIRQRNQLTKLESIYRSALRKMHASESERDFLEVALQFDTIASYQDAAALANSCRNKASEAKRNAEEAKRRAEEARLEGLYSAAANKMKTALTQNACLDAAKAFEDLGEFRDAAEMAQRCRDMAEEIYRNNVLTTGKAFMDKVPATVANYKTAIEEFRRIPGWKDADRMIAVCQSRIGELEVQAEEERLARERKAELARKEAVRIAKRNKRIALIATAAVLLCAAFTVLWINVLAPLLSYNKAQKLMDSGAYQEAMDAFRELGDYKDAPQKVLEANYLLAETYFAAGDHDTAIRIFEALGDFSDAPERLKEVTYAQAESLLDAGEFHRAIRLFLSLEEYNGAADRARNELYAQGERLLAAGDYDEAADIFGSLGAYSDARERLKEAKYAKADALAQAGSYEEAAGIFLTLFGYEDSSARYALTLLEYATALLGEGMYSDAMKQLDQIGDGSIYREDANALYVRIMDECYEKGFYGTALSAYGKTKDYVKGSAKYNDLAYKNAQKLYAAQDYGNAKTYFQRTPGYLDADRMAKDCDYQRGTYELSRKNFDRAKEAFQNIPGYSNANSMVLECDYQKGLDQLSRKKYSDAIKTFEQITGYKDSATQIKEVKYQYVLNNKDRKNKTTHAYLKDLKAAWYKDSVDLFKELYAWKVELLAVNSDPDDTKTNLSAISVYEPVYFHYKLTGGEPDAEVVLTRKVFLPNGNSATSEWPWAAKDGTVSWFGWANGIYSNPDQGARGIVKAQIFDDAGNMIGEFSIRMTS